MRDFVYYTPTEVVFGRESEDQIVPLLKKYGAGRTGIYFGRNCYQSSGFGCRGVFCAAAAVAFQRHRER